MSSYNNDPTPDLVRQRMTMSASEFNDYVADRILLHCLQEGGVDKWEGYEEAVDKYLLIRRAAEEQYKINLKGPNQS